MPPPPSSAPLRRLDVARAFPQAHSMGDLARRDALFEYVGFGDRDVVALTSAGPVLREVFADLVEDFCASLARDPDARAVLGPDERQRFRQRLELSEWLHSLVAGRYDETWLARVENVGRMHVRVQLPQRYMLLAMSRVRAALHSALWNASLPREDARDAHVALDKLCDVELALMLDAYRERDVSRERLAALGQLAASIGHELRTPLATIRTSAYLAREGDGLEHLDKIDRQATLAEKIITDILEMVRDAPPAREPIDLRALLDEACVAAQGECTALEVDPAAAEVHADRVALRQLLVNLIDNAQRSAREHHPDARVMVSARADDTDLVIEVRDGGRGFPRQILEKRFAPLSSTRPDGIGLGLALCARIVERHGGSLHAENPPEGGALVVARIAQAIQEGPR
ncbi:MAG TPA: hypothetical protein DEF51_41050 [Myxococcales bacterium]|nr:hypothetical protein [Myxococcales bacterium]